MMEFSENDCRFKSSAINAHNFERQNIVDLQQDISKVPKVDQADAQCNEVKVKVEDNLFDNNEYYDAINFVSLQSFENPEDENLSYEPKNGHFEGISCGMGEDKKNSFTGKIEPTSKTFKCELCEYESKQKSCLRQHFKIEHESPHLVEKEHQCLHCPYKSAEKSDLVKHIQTHTDVNDQQCPLKIHTDVKYHQCPLCTYKTSRKSNLSQHIKTHIGEKDHQCPHCVYKTVHKSNLVQHLKIHSGEKDHQCPQCVYKTAHKSNLVQHLKFHLGQKDHQCPFCTYKTGHKSNLVQHLKTHTGEKDHECPYCVYRTVHKSNLVQHIKKHVK